MDGELRTQPTKYGADVILSDAVAKMAPSVEALRHALMCRDPECAECAGNRERAAQWASEHPNYCNACGRWDSNE